MNRRLSCLIALFIALLVLTSCSTMTNQQPGKPPVSSPRPAGAIHSDTLQPTLWMQTAPEYRANTRLVFAVARSQLDVLQARPDVTGALEQAAVYGCEAGRACDALAADVLRPAVVLDIDETVLDNSPYQARRALEGTSFDPVSWDLWLAERAAPAIAGAVEFIKAARARGIAVIYITNRRCAARDDAAMAPPCPQRQDTLDNLASAGIPALGEHDLLMLRAERPQWDQSEKQLRRAHVAERYRIIMLIGDDIGDLAANVKGLPIPEKFSFVDRHEHLLGIHWFQLTNPIYGSWTRSFGSSPPGDYLRTH